MSEKIAILAILVFAIAAVQIWRVSKTDTTQRWASTLQSVLTICGILLAAYWFFVERKGQPHANVSQTIHAARLDRNVVAVEVHVYVENLGSTLLKIRRLNVRLQQVRPARYNYLAVSEIARPWTLRKPLEQGQTVKKPFFNFAEHLWPTIREFDNSSMNHDVEPGETDLMVATFFVPCSLEIIRISTQVQKKKGNKPGMDQVWRTKTFGDITALCRAQGADNLYSFSNFSPSS